MYHKLVYDTLQTKLYSMRMDTELTTNGRVDLSVLEGAFAGDHCPGGLENYRKVVGY